MRGDAALGGGTGRLELSEAPHPGPLPASGARGTWATEC